MKRHGLAATAIICCSLMVSGCALIKAAGALGTLFGGRKTSTVATVVKIIGSVLGQFYDTTTKQALVGSWAYEEPAIQFESNNLLDKAGGVVASQTVADNIAPYLKKLGIKPGKIGLDLHEDNTCTYTLGKNSFDGTYDFDDESKKLTLKVGIIPLPSAYLSVVGDQMAMTFDSNKLLKIVQALGSISDQPSLSAVSQLAESYDGMTTGFTFARGK